MQSKFEQFCENIFDSGAETWDMMTDEEQAQACRHWLASPWNQTEVGEIIAHSPRVMTLAEMLQDAFVRDNDAEVGAFVRNIVKERVKADTRWQLEVLFHRTEEFP